MQTMEQRVREHAVAAGILEAGRPVNSYEAEGAAWCADACASALEAGADLRDVSADISASMRRAGASGGEQVYAQLVVAEIEALVERLVGGGKGEGLPEAVRATFTWTETPPAGDGIKHVLALLNVGGLPALERRQAKEIYLTAMLVCFHNRARAFRAWSNWVADPKSTQARAWMEHHARAQKLAFVGLDVAPTAQVRMRFKLES